MIEKHLPKGSELRINLSEASDKLMRTASKLKKMRHGQEKWDAERETYLKFDKRYFSVPIRRA